MEKEQSCKKIIARLKRINLFSQYKFRLVAVIILVALIILAIGFYITYQIYIDRIKEQTISTTQEIFGQMAENIYQRLEGTENITTNFLAVKDVGSFFENDYASVSEKSITERNVITKINNVINENQTIYSIALIGPEGRALGASRFRIFSERLKGDDALISKLKNLFVNNPSHTAWIGGNELDEFWNNDESSRHMLNVPCIVGIRQVKGYGHNQNKESYSIVAMKENTLLGPYFQAVYDHSNIILTNDDGVALASLDKSILGKEVPSFNSIDKSNPSNAFVWEDDIEYQIIAYKLLKYDFYLVNQIPYSSYVSQASTVGLWILLIAVITLLLLATFCVMWTLRFTRPIDELINRMKEMGKGNLSLTPINKSGILELDMAGEQLRRVAGELEISIQKIKTVEEQKHVEELRVLQYQINPHFLFNSLNSIRWMAMMSGAPNVSDALVTLVKIITPILRSPSFFWTVREEIEFANNYVKMMSIRYGANLTYQLSCDENLYDMNFPRFVLQPIIENCFEHGIKLNDTLDVLVSIIKTESLLNISVSDNGTGISDEQVEKLNLALAEMDADYLSGSSIGLRNVSKRLFLLYNNNSKMWVESVIDKQTVVNIEILL